TNNATTVKTTIRTSADVGVVKTVPATAPVNSNISYDITLNNAGPSDTRSGSLTFTDAVPSGTTFVAMTQNTGPTFNCITPAVGGTGNVTCSINSLAAAASANFT